MLWWFLIKLREEKEKGKGPSIEGPFISREQAEIKREKAKREFTFGDQFSPVFMAENKLEVQKSFHYIELN